MPLPGVLSAMAWLRQLSIKLLGKNQNIKGVRGAIISPLGANLQYLILGHWGQ